MGTSSAAPEKVPFKKRLKQLFDAYGAVAIGTYVVLAICNFAGVYLAMRLGWHPSGVMGQGATLGAAYVVYKLTMPVRILGTIGLTPLVARVLRRPRAKRRKESA